MLLRLFSCTGGFICLPSRNGALVGREDGGNLLVNPPRDVWERGELSAEELRDWSFLVAAAARAMLETLPQLDGGCINYWEAGNWALNDDAPPKGRKRARDHRSMHLHLLGRSINATDPNWRWGESPVFPRYAQKDTRSRTNARLTPDETKNIIAAVKDILIAKYQFTADRIAANAECRSCGYSQIATERRVCPECAA